MNGVAFVTYNSVGNGLSSGWHTGPNGRRALVLQNTKGEGTCSAGPTGATRRQEEADLLWEKLRRELPNLDHVVVYVGDNGSQRAIELVSSLPASKLTFVSCTCGLVEKTMMLATHGLRDAGKVLCECGGHYTMKELFDSFMASGELQPSVPELSMN